MPHDKLKTASSQFFPNWFLATITLVEFKIYSPANPLNVRVGRPPLRLMQPNLSWPRTFGP